MMSYCLCFVLVSILATLECRPDLVDNNMFKQTERQLQPDEKLLFPQKPPLPTISNTNQQFKIDEKTKEILRKIEEVNTQQGYHRRKFGPKYSRPPYTYYSRSQYQKQNNNMELLKYVMANPILEYLKAQNNHIQPTTNPRLISPHQTTENTNEHDNQDKISEYSQPIRQVTHYQVIALPTSNFNPQMNNAPYQQNMPNAYDTNFYNPSLMENQQEINEDMKQEGRQNWNWPGANLFPIYIRDPFLQFYYAVTNMVEYGPNAGSGGPCKLTPVGGKINKLRLDNSKTGDKMKPTTSLRMVDAAEIFRNPLSNDYLDVEDILTSDDTDLSFIVKDKEPAIQSREATGNEIIVKSRGKPFIYTPKNPKSQMIISKQNSESIESTPQLNPDISLGSLEETEIESQKNDISVSNEGSRKVFSKDNTGNGIFIHKIRVKQGGVAIAGPGGIASAGEGGTAIVGPNGIAYTTAEGTAIAGTGGKIIGAEESLGLMDIIKTAIQQSGNNKNQTTEKNSKPELVAKPNSSLNNKPSRPNNPFFNFNNNKNR